MLRQVYEMEIVERERVTEDFIFLGFLFCDVVLVKNLSLRNFAGFYLLWVPQDKYLCLVYLDVLVILSIKYPNQNELK